MQRMRRRQCLAHVCRQEEGVEAGILERKWLCRRWNEALGEPGDGAVPRPDVKVASGVALIDPNQNESVRDGVLRVLVDLQQRLRRIRKSGAVEKRTAVDHPGEELPI